MNIKRRTSPYIAYFYWKWRKIQSPLNIPLLVACFSTSACARRATGRKISAVSMFPTSVLYRDRNSIDVQPWVWQHLQ
jgi:hypothetical protein